MSNPRQTAMRTSMSLTRIGERVRRGALARVSNVVRDHGQSCAGRDDDASCGQASGRRLGLVEHGSGTIPLVLLHGWPQTSHVWRHVTPLLASHCHTLAYDLPGIGSSEEAIDRFDKWSISEDLHASLDQRGIRRPLVVGHDMGAQVAYAYLRRYPTQVRGVMLLDTPIAGVGGGEDLFTSPAFWHIGFHQTRCGDTGLAELLVTGQEHRYFRSHIDRFAAHPDAISDADVAVYAQGYQGPRRLAAGFALYRAIPLDIARNERHTGTVDPPIQLAFAEYCHATVLPEVAAGLGEAGTRSVATSIIADSGHWVAEEQPATVAAAINRFIAAT
jgi:pimeloyl-ACP methyl ester carboxylesterase